MTLLGSWSSCGSDFTRAIKTLTVGKFILRTQTELLLLIKTIYTCYIEHSFDECLAFFF